jgi:hypothetical protein
MEECEEAVGAQREASGWQGTSGNPRGGIVIHNERTKLLATALNNLGVGCILAGVIVPTVNGQVADIAHVALWLAFGVNFITYAQVWLGRL